MLKPFFLLKVEIWKSKETPCAYEGYYRQKMTQKKTIDVNR